MEMETIMEDIITETYYMKIEKTKRLKNKLYALKSNLTNTQFNVNEMNLLKLGFKHAIPEPKNKKLETLSIEIDTLLIKDKTEENTETMRSKCIVELKMEQT